MYLTKKQYGDYQKYCSDKLNGKILTLDGLRFICEANNNNPELIGKCILETLVKYQNEYK